MNTDAILNKLHIEELNPMQQDVSHALLHSDRDVVVLSPTGSGKTLAYLLPLVQMLDAKLDRLQAVVVVPGRELALQSATVLNDMGCGLRAMSLYGGRPAMDEHRQMRRTSCHGRTPTDAHRESADCVCHAWKIERPCRQGKPLGRRRALPGA